MTIYISWNLITIILTLLLTYLGIGFIVGFPMAMTCNQIFGNKKLSGFLLLYLSFIIGWLPALLNKNT